MAFDKQRVYSLGGNATKTVKAYFFYNSGSDDVTATGYFDWDVLKAGDQIKVVSADYKSTVDYYVSAVSGGSATVKQEVASEILAVVVDGTALPITKNIITFDTTAGAQSFTLADGVQGQRIVMVMTVDGGTNTVITPANLGNGSTLTFADVGDACEIIFLGTDWWVVGNTGVAIA
jgi:hypothetical protein